MNEDGVALEARFLAIAKSAAIILSGLNSALQIVRVLLEGGWR